MLDFRPGGNVPGGVNYLTLSPQVAQVFFIGDGLTDGGVPQQVLVPTGATHLYLGFADGFQWSNNVGSYSVSVEPAVSIATLPEPPALALAALGTVVAVACRRRRRAVRGGAPSP
jgi:hypothetical protein